MKKISLKILVFFGLAAMASRSIADQTVYSPDYIAVLPGYSFPSKAYGTTGNGATVSGIYGREFESHFGFEANIQSSAFETGTRGGTDFYQYGATFDATYALFDRHAGTLLTPFVLAGIGAAYDDFYPNNRDGAALLGEAGVGLVSRPLFSGKIQLRVDARYVHDGKQGGHGEGRLIAGIEIPLGRTVSHIEYLPGKVEIRETVREVVRPFVDTDGDGVDDEHDQCPNTPRGMRVNAVGCAVQNQVFGLQGVTFDYNKARLTPNAETVLDIVSRAFAGQPTLKVEIAGHTDSVGSIKANLTLSQLRAEAVRSYLIAKGVRPDLLTAVGYGKSQLLINPESNALDQERNRRVELRVLAQ